MAVVILSTLSPDPIPQQLIRPRSVPAASRDADLVIVDAQKGAIECVRSFDVDTALWSG